MKAQRPLDLYKSRHWIDPGDNLPSIVTVTKRMKDGTVYYRGIAMYDGKRWEIVTKYRDSAEYFDENYKAITTDDFMRRLAYRQGEHTHAELLANAKREECRTVNLQAHAALIVRAVNGHDKADALVAHILSMAGDAYLQGHPEWNEIVKDAEAYEKEATR